MSLNGLEKAIILSVSYSNLFLTPLSGEEIWLRLITKKKISLKIVKKTLAKLVQKGLINKDGDCYFIVDKKLPTIKAKRVKYSKEKLIEANLLINKAKLIPFVKAIVITGSLSVSNAKKNDDIDWLIITSKNTLWLTRPLIILIASFYGKRRERSGNHRDNSWCFNMFMTEDHLTISQRTRNIYTAYEVCQAKFIYDIANIEETFLKNNSWVGKYLNNFFKFRLNKAKSRLVNKDRNDESYKNIAGAFLSILNKALFYGQYLYMKKGITREVVKINTAFFHPRDTSSRVLKKWKQVILKKYARNS